MLVLCGALSLDETQAFAAADRAGVPPNTAKTTLLAVSLDRQLQLGMRTVDTQQRIRRMYDAMRASVASRQSNRSAEASSTAGDSSQPYPVPYETCNDRRVFVLDTYGRRVGHPS